MSPADIQVGKRYEGWTGPSRWVESIREVESRWCATYTKGKGMRLYRCALSTFAAWSRKEIVAHV